MDYKAIYDKLVERGRICRVKEYTEIHHIIPRCMGGSDDSTNLTHLTPEEHYIAHQLLVKIYPNNMSLVRAAIMMIPNRPSNKLYGWLRRRHQKAMSVCQAGEGNSQFGSRWIFNTELKLSKKIPKKEELPANWHEGRIVNFDTYLEKIEKINKEKDRKENVAKIKKLQKIKNKHYMFKKTVGYRRAKSIKLYKEFVESNLSLRKFAESKGMVPMTLSNWFSEFISEYKIAPRKSANKQILGG